LNQFFEWNISALVEALDSAVQDARDGRFVPPDVAHERIRTMYTWDNVARRTEKVYDLVRAVPHVSFDERLKRLYHCGRVAGKIFCILAVIDLFILWLLEWLFPRKNIDIAPSFQDKHDIWNPRNDSIPSDQKESVYFFRRKRGSDYSSAR